MAKKFVDPLLPSGEIEGQLVAGMSSNDAKTALLFLELQIQDSRKDYGLTKLSYEALVLAALRDTDTSKRLARGKIYDRVHLMLSSHTRSQIEPRVDAALNRLSASALRHRKDQDEFHLRDEERVRVIDAAAKVQKLRGFLEKDIVDCLALMPGLTVVDQPKFVSYAREILETYFLRKGEDFTRAATLKEAHRFDEITLKSVIFSLARRSIGITGANLNEVTRRILENVLASPSSGAGDYIRLLLQSYTLFSFLAATPDVQKVTKEMFGTGEIWLDTSIILPLLAEVSVIDSRKPLSEMFKQCHSSGLKVYVTAGVIEEVERHINSCIAFSRSDSWNGDVPFLYASYVFYGGKRDGFASWSEKFAGYFDPIQDISDYLRRNHAIKVNRANNRENISPELEIAVRAAWQDVHSRRRPDDSLMVIRLAEHDAENYLHILSSRIAQRGRVPLGYSDWWLTLDSAAREILGRLGSEVRATVKVGPVMSIDYLIRYLAFGPNRERTDFSGAALSKIYSGVIMESIPPELLNIVDKIRDDQSGLEEHMIERKIREGILVEKTRIGAIEAAGLSNIAAAIDKTY